MHLWCVNNTEAKHDPGQSVSMSVNGNMYFAIEYNIIVSILKKNTLKLNFIWSVTLNKNN